MSDIRLYKNSPQSEYKAITFVVLLYFLKVFISPIAGWKSLKVARLKAEHFSSKLFYPIVALISAFEFFQLFYNAKLSVTTLLQDAVVTFVAFYAGYYSILFLSEFLFKKEIRASLMSDFGKIYIMINLMTLALFYLVFELIPMAGPILVFTPIYTLYLIIKGAKTLRLPDEYFSASILKLSALIIGMPIVIYYFFNLIMPTA